MSPKKSLFRRWLSWMHSVRGAKLPAAPYRPFRPSLEQLETRETPSVVTVSPGDNIQAKINAASPGDTLTFVAAEFDQQFTVDRDLTLLGNGATIQAPATLTPTTFGPYSVRDIIDITGGATVTITGFTVAGPGPGQFNSIDDGIFVFGGATATISGCTIRDIRDDPLSGIQTGVGIQVGWASLGQVGRATLTNDAVLGSQKGNIVIDGAGSTATVDSCTVTGVGPTPTIAENGVQVSRGAAGRSRTASSAATRTRASTAARTRSLRRSPAASSSTRPATGRAPPAILSRRTTSASTPRARA